MNAGRLKPSSVSLLFSSSKKSARASEQGSFLEKEALSFLKDSDLTLWDFNKWKVLMLNDAKKQNKKKIEKYVVLFDLILKQM